MTTILKPNKWPYQRDCVTFYGNPNLKGWVDKNLVKVQAPWQMKYGGKDVNFIPIHRLCKDSLERIFDWTWEKVDKSQSKIIELHFDLYSGSYVLRPMRKAKTLSMHAYGAALDMADRFNPFQSQNHLFTKDTLLIAAALQESCVWGGAWNPPDGMHIQWARVR
jgi:D-alanyl-D-alanine carboxypeptidase